MSDNSLNIPDVPPEGFFGDLQEFQAWLMNNIQINFTTRSGCNCPIARFLKYKWGVVSIVNIKFTYFGLKTFPTPQWMKKIISRVDLDCNELHQSRIRISAARVLELSKA